MNMTGKRALLSTSIVATVAVLVLAFVWHGTSDEETTARTIIARPTRNLANDTEKPRAHRPISHQPIQPPRTSRPVSVAQHHGRRKNRPIRHSPDEIQKRNAPRF